MCFLAQFKWCNQCTKRTNWLTIPICHISLSVSPFSGLLIWDKGGTCGRFYPIWTLRWPKARWRGKKEKKKPFAKVDCENVSASWDSWSKLSSRNAGTRCKAKEMSWICNPFLMATSISLVNNMRSSMITITYTSINMDLKPWLVMSSVILIWQPIGLRPTHWADT